MKKKILIALLTISGVLYGQDKVTITGEIINPTGDMVYLKSWMPKDQNWEEVIHDSCQLSTEGKFELNAKTDSLTNFQMNDGNEHVQLYLNPGENVHLSLNTKYFDETITFTGDGAERNNLMVSIYLISEVNMMKSSLMMNAVSNEDEPDTTTLFRQFYSQDSSLIAFIEDAKVRHPEMKDFLDQQITNVNRSTNWVKSGLVRRLKMEKIEKEEMGKALYNMTGVDLKGKKKSLSDFYGKPIVVDFWATWCGPCKYQFPFLAEIEEKYGDQVTFLSVGVWCKEDEWKEMSKDYGFPYNLFLEKEETEILKEKYLLTSIPRYMILDKDGNILDVNAVRPTLGLEDRLKELFDLE